LSGLNDDRLRDVLKTDENLGIFLRNAAEFERLFCAMMMGGVDFTLRFEVHGERGRLNHCRVYSDRFDRPEERPRPGRQKTAVVKRSSVS